MKVTGIETILLNNNPPYHGGRTFLFIKLSTDEGIVGLGERPTGHTPDLTSQIALLHDLVNRFVVGKSPFEIERIWQSIYASNHDYRHPSLYGTPALSAIEMALWDIVGKATNQPIYNLLGGPCHDRLRAYAYMPTQGVWEDPRKAGDIAAKLVAEGNTACKIDPFMPYYPLPRDFPLKTIKHAARIFEAIRDAVGDDLEIGIGTHGQFSTAGAIRVASVFEQFNPFWFEEPVPPENVDEMARVRRPHQHPHRLRRAPGEHLRVLGTPGEAGRADHPTRRRPMRRHPRVEEDRRHRRGPLRDDRPAHVRRAGRRRGRRAGGRLLAELPHPGVQRRRPARGTVHQSHPLRERVSSNSPPARAWVSNSTRTS